MPNVQRATTRVNADAFRNAALSRCANSLGMRGLIAIDPRTMRRSHVRRAAPRVDDLQEVRAIARRLRAGPVWHWRCSMTGGSISIRPHPLTRVFSRVRPGRAGVHEAVV